MSGDAIDRVVSAHIRADNADTVLAEMLKEVCLKAFPSLQLYATVGDLVFIAQEVDPPACLRGAEQGLDGARSQEFRRESRGAW
jgi:hypothetical protein